MARTPKRARVKSRTESASNERKRDWTGSKRAKGSRAKTSSDELYNARKRFWRSAERNLKKAEQATGASAAKYRRLAEQELKAALSTYDTSKTVKYSKPIQRLAQTLKIDLSAPAKQLDTEAKTRVIQRSYETLESRLQNPEVRRDRQARAILNNTEIGSRILGGLVEVWRDKATVWDEKQQKWKIDNELIYDILTEYFKVESIADVLDKLQEQFGERLYDVTEERANIYEVVKLMIQSKVADNTLVQ